MSTVKQEKALDEIVENGGNVSKAMRDVGYSVETAKTPSKLTESKGYKELLEKSGLTPKLIAEALAQDIEKNPGRRLGELSLGADLTGMKSKGANITAVQVNINEDRENFA